jgi:subtilisin family serine protease
LNTQLQRFRGWRLAAVTAGIALALAPLAPATAATISDQAERAPLMGTDIANRIADQYVVVLDNDASDAKVASARAAATAAGGEVLFTYGHAIKGFAAKLPPAALAAVRASANVDYVEADASIQLDLPASEVSDQTTQRNPTWGLDRVDQKDLPLNNKYTYNNDGTGVTVYVIDSGIRITHTQFEGRASHGFDAVDGGPADDCNGHGTHVAGTVGSAKYGVAKKVSLVAVRVLDCDGNGSFSGVIAGIDWVTEHAPLQAIANMSLGAPGRHSATEQAITESINAGVPYAIAAGNDGVNACDYTPARTPRAITVGATDDGDWETWFSNYGECLDIWAPGQDITSTWNTSDTATNTINGTSMASPHVAGVAALYNQLHPSATSAAISKAVVNQATRNTVSLIGPGSPNKFLFSRVV